MSVTLLRKLGIYIQPDFLSGRQCQTICEAIRNGAHSEASLYDQIDGKSGYDADRRKSYFAKVPGAIGDMVDDKIRSLKPTLEEHFQETFDERFERSKFLLYCAGNFFGPHRDSQLGRRVNMSIYLNDQTEDGANGTYSGGVLKIYGLIDKPEWENKGVSLHGTKGMLVGYPAHLVHEITPVTSGERCAIVARFLEEAV